ncbi:PREDICTED: uncharacterized protein LOC109241667 [Nicotiana attenuata]|uniref:uncharacterized protein LOC109241667 n=1 Tax=Nicotiana attenuata TaxID=49451 RepID=UPI0009059DA1|nr:PREDICTED: uncharacterized protein LOC109241667 [Nicotiana attenuata]
MAKAYNRLSWSFLIEVLNKFGFYREWSDMNCRIFSNVWYSIIISGTRHGFFTYSQGLKQGDLLSPSLFILAAEVLSRSLNNLHHNENFTRFSMNKRGPQINHLAYVDDIVIFCGGNSKTVNLVIKEIRKYEKASGQLVNKDKGFFLTGPKASAYRINRLRDCTVFMDKSFPFTYLGCPIYIGKKKSCFFDNMVTKVVKRLNVWQGKMLTYSGRVVLIKSVLQSMPTHTLTALNLPKDEGGIGIKSLEAISNTLTIKRWWRFRIKPSLWLDFLKAKYCPRSHPVKKKWISGNSQAWKHLLLARDKAEGNISWQINSGDCNFWWDNWTMTGPLAYSNANLVTTIGNKTNSCEFIINGRWDINKLRNTLTNQLVEVISNINIGQSTEKDDVVWNGTEDGHYSNKFA